jgi:hypothetical protein
MDNRPTFISSQQDSGELARSKANAPSQNKLKAAMCLNDHSSRGFDVDPTCILSILFKQLQIRPLQVIHASTSLCSMLSMWSFESLEPVNNASLTQIRKMTGKETAYGIEPGAE